MSKMASFLKDESGAAAAEYVLILAILGSAIVVAITKFGNTIATALNNAGTAISAVNF
ncbi:Flp family type IVb pilin [Phenylobacterium montanum]|uniref:Flp family type IVb pilin n=1 Tax=Phenylobacterium montanum TaxID=2823693 RepID=A0A975G163_9CAUL|nr:Flp family type IVb pilin [Caulobacter sp. S6]QUD88587.1 Flp family type IVb pilin [Caulobacter sp. S6]